MAPPPPRSTDPRGGRSRSARAAAATLVAGAALLAACSSTAPAASPPTTSAAASTSVPGTPVSIDGLIVVALPAPKHVEGEVDYPQTPPLGGDHAPRWQNCGAYTEPISKEAGVHSLEHGAVWITYQPSLDPASIAALERLADQSDYVLVSPWPDDLPAPIVASAWGAQLRLDSVDDPRLVAFLTAYVQALTAPEPGAPCSGGVGTPG